MSKSRRRFVAIAIGAFGGIVLLFVYRDLNIRIVRAVCVMLVLQFMVVICRLVIKVLGRIYAFEVSRTRVTAPCT